MAELASSSTTSGDREKSPLLPAKGSAGTFTEVFLLLLHDLGNEDSKGYDSGELSPGYVRVSSK